jgi:S-formylglutathione hydrolase FrmB
MKSWKWLVPGAALIVGAVLISCSQHDNPLVHQTVGTGRSSGTGIYAFTAQLNRFSANDKQTRVIDIAYASDEDLFTPQAPFPVLYLLHDFGGDAQFYERYGLQDILDDMYAKGEIGRMLVVTVDASSYFGGAYYRNSATSGKYEDMITALVNYIENSGTFHVHSRGGRAARAIGGFGMGGYGAMRYALDHPDIFSSISAASAPLAFGDPQQGTGFWNPTTGMVAQMYAENGTGVGDLNLYAALRAGWLKPNTNLFFAMSAAFSPHPLQAFDSVGCKIICRFPPGGCVLKDTVCGIDFFSPRPPDPHTITFPAPVDTFGVGVDAFVDSSGQLVDSLWRLWHDSADVATVFQRQIQADPNLWKNTKIYMDVGTQDEFGYLEQNRTFDGILTNAGIPHTYIEYGPAGAIPATHSEQLASRLRSLIRFHSENLARPEGSANK